MKNNKIKRFYIMPEVWVTVTQSQVFNWIKLVNDRGISTDCISITVNKNNTRRVKSIEESIKGQFIEVHDPRRLIVSDIFITLVLLKYYFKNVFRYKKIIFQTRLGSIGFIYALLKVLPRTRLVFEGRGAGNEERIHSTKGNKVSLKTKIKTFFSETNEKLLLTKSNKVISVSYALKKYYMNKFGLTQEKFSVFPGAADSDLFFYKEKLRNKVRKELSLKSDDILIVYSGRLEMKWEIPDKIFDFFKDIHSKDSRFKLLLITPDIEIASELINDNKFKDITYVKRVELKEVNKYLNAADVGLLLREDVVMNNVASPTKFAEYIMAGLPVIVSSGVHDFAQNVRETKYGTVVESVESISDDEYTELVGSLTIDKDQIANWGLNNLSKKSFIEKYVKMLKEV